MNDSDRSWLARLVRRGVVPAGAVGAQRLGTGDHLADVGEHLGVALAGLVVGPRQAALHGVEHEGQRRGHDEGDDGQQPVVGQHHAGDGEHQRAVEQPRQAAPGEELGERLDVAGHPGDERALPLLVVVGDAQPVDVLEQAHAQRVQRLLAARAEPGDGRALADRGDHDDHQADRGSA